MSYQNALRVASVYAKGAEENDDPQEAIDLYKKALGYCAEALGKCTNDADMRLVEDRIGTYKGRIKRLTEPPRPVERTYRQRAEDDTKPKERFELTQPKTTFADVAGMDELKGRMERAIIWPLMYPDRYEGFVGKKSKGILLYGPPGCGKTYVAKSVAGEATKRAGRTVSFIYAKASDVLDSWVGNSEKNMRAAFETAADKAPSILFFDELDGLGGARRGRSVYADRLVNEFLTDFDIVEDKTVLVLGATNTPWEVDAALIRSGRIGRKILVGPPDHASRAALFKLHSKGRQLAADVDFAELARLTEDYAASDIAQVCDVAGELALEDGINDTNRRIEQRDCVTAIAENCSSLEAWCLEADRQLRDPEIAAAYPGLREMVQRVKARKVAR